MHEFHGWLAIPDGPSADMDSRIPDISMEGLVSVQRTEKLNGWLVTLLFSGLRNHHYSRVMELCQAVARVYPEAYGLVYSHDDESTHDNEFVVVRVVRGKLETTVDRLLSPRIPTLEDPYSGNPDT